MRLSGDMMGSMDLLSEDGAVITYGFDQPDQAIKAYAHQTGFEGHPTIKGPKREFFGVTSEEIKKEVLPKFSSQISGSGISAASLFFSQKTVQVQDKLINTINAADLFAEEV
jgi:hypothetical protein